MMTKLVAVAMALASSTCCPSLFLSVQKGRPAPRLPMPEPKIARTPIPTPSYLRNRFLNKPTDESAPNAKKVLDTELDLYSEYTDMPSEKNQLVRALSSLEQLEDKYGISRKPRLRLIEDPEKVWPKFIGTLTCDAHYYCSEIKQIERSDRFRKPSASDRLSAFDEIEKMRLPKQTDTVVAFGPSPVPPVPKTNEEIEQQRAAQRAKEIEEECKSSSFAAGQIVEILVAGNSEASYRRVLESKPEYLAGSNACTLKLRGGIPGSNDAPMTIQVIYDGNDHDMPRLSQTLLSFVHLTDAQIRDRDALLGNARLSHRLDWLIEQSFEYNRDLIFGNMYLIEALFATINKEIRCLEGGDVADCATNYLVSYTGSRRNQEKPAFVIHTGDAIDAGLMSELDIFHRLVDGLNAPFFNAIGNHDVLVFGNLMPTSNSHSDAECATVASVGGVKASWLRSVPVGRNLCVNARVRCRGSDCDGIRSPELVVPGKIGEPITHANARAHFIKAFDHEVGVQVPMPKGPEWERETQIEGTPAKTEVDGAKTSRRQTSEEANRAKAEQLRNDRCSEQLAPHTSPWLHGFAPGWENRNYPGYYAFSTKLADIDDGAGERYLVSIVLDTEDLNEKDAGVKGRIQEDQMTWLKEVLDCAGQRDLIIVFGHDAISMIETKEAGEFERVLGAHRNVIAYFFGHDHKHEICNDKKGDRREVCAHFWEVQTASLLEFPQEARRVKIKYAGKGIAFLEVVAFRENLADPHDQLGRAVELARSAAQRDQCITDANVKCSDDHRVYREDGYDANARLWFKLP